MPDRNQSATPDLLYKRMQKEIIFCPNNDHLLVRAHHERARNQNIKAAEPRKAGLVRGIEIAMCVLKLYQLTDGSYVIRQAKEKTHCDPN